MPLVQTSTYKPALIFRIGHINTIYPAIFRKISSYQYKRQRINTPDGDFLDLDWSRKGNKKLVIVLHGLEGNAARPYVQGMIQYFNKNNWDGVGLNLRSCSGEPNKKSYSYNMGSSNDLDTTIKYITKHFDYQEITLIGFSMGGNIILKYLGEGNSMPTELKAAVTFSVPCHIPTATIEIERWQNWLYVKRFMNGLNEKMHQKAKIFPETIEANSPMPRNFTEFDERYTAPLSGFKNNFDYWTKSSCLQFLSNISIPTLLVNAKDDSFLSEKCFPFQIAEENPHFYLETPKWGGHVGFSGNNHSKNVYWSEKRALDFLTTIV